MITSSDSDATETDRRKRKRHSVAQVKGHWTPSDDQKLARLVCELGEGKWSIIAAEFPGRIGKQCRERWNNQLRPDIKKDAWTLLEEEQLIRVHKQVGNRWADIAKEIPGRTENAVKNHWNATLRKAGKPGLRNHTLVQYMCSLGHHVQAEQSAASRLKHRSAPDSSSHSCTSSLKHGSRKQQPATVAESKPGYVAVAHIRQNRRAAAALARQAIQRLQADSDTDFSSEYMSQACDQGVVHSNAALATSQQFPSTAVSGTACLHEAPTLQLGIAPLHAAGPHNRKKGDPRLVRTRSLPVAPQLQAENDLLLRSLQDIIPADLLEAELSDTGMEGFCFDDDHLDGAPAGPMQLATGVPDDTGKSLDSAHQAAAHVPVYQQYVKPTDPRLAKLDKQHEPCAPAPSSHAAQPVQHAQSEKSSCVALPVPHAQGSGELVSALQEETGETCLQPPASQAPSSAASTNVPSTLEADSTPKAKVQSSNLIHIQMTPLQSLDSYASKLKTDGMEVAIYSGSCPLRCLACPQPSRGLQHQVLTKLQNVCGWLRVSSHYQVGSLLIAVRAGPVPAGISGLVIAASAKAMPLALQAVKAAVRQIEALSMDDAAAQGSGVAF